MIWWITLFFIGCVNANDLYLRDYGAYVSGESDVNKALQNGEIFLETLQKANNGDRIILSEYETMYFIPDSYAEELHNISIVLNGNLILHNNISAWGYVEETESYLNAIDIRKSTNITITGNGVMDGRGHSWWFGFLKGTVSRRRPTMIEINDGVDILIEKITMINSPRFHIYCDNVLRLEVQYLMIWVEIDYIYPFNTDGVDFNGKDIYIHDLIISNYDDSVCVKPSRITTPSLDGETMTCSENILVENIYIYFGVGLSIGSVSSTENNCIRNVTFQNIYAYNPLKFIYIKTGNVDDATDVNGIIENVTYRNMTAYDGVLWPIYIGPQQQKEPDGSGAGIWPDVNPYITIKNILLENIKVTMVDNNIAAGVLRCGPTNPCKELEFRNVVVDSNKQYICSESGTLYGTYNNESNPGLNHCGLELQ